MRLLLVKTSSLGDLIHTFPALTDAANQIPGFQVDWVVEEAFRDVPSWHPAVARVIPIGFRKWRKNIRVACKNGELTRFYQDLRRDAYDMVLDAQGLLIKSGVIAKMARGTAVGYDWSSARDGWSSICYNRKINVPRTLHAIERTRRLFADAIGYTPISGSPEYSLEIEANTDARENPYVVFLHGTTWATKHWPEKYWVELSRLIHDAGFHIKLPWGSPDERLRAERIIKAGYGNLVPRSSLSELAGVIKGASAVVGVDSGLAHLAAALERPMVCLYGPTDANLTGTMGVATTNLQADYECVPCMNRECKFTGEQLVVEPPCFESLPPEAVWKRLQQKMTQTDS